MKLKRNSTGQTVPLEDGFLWSDEFTYKPIEQTTERGLNGALIVQEGKKLAGRPITLSPPDQEMGWIQRFNLSILQDWASMAGELFTLIFEYPHDTRQFNVMFRHSDGAIEASPVLGHPSVSNNEYYRATLRFLELN